MLWSLFQTMQFIYEFTIYVPNSVQDKTFIPILVKLKEVSSYLKRFDMFDQAQSLFPVDLILLVVKMRKEK